MNNELKFNYIKQHWQLRDGVVYTRWGNRPVAFSSKNKQGHRFTVIEINRKRHAVLIHNAIFMLHHDRAIAEDKEIHHKDGNPENNNIENLIELTDKQHRRIHFYQR
ncbi:HNH endonuclease, partial [Escherichia coli]